MRKDDIIRDRHMLDSAGEALSFAKGKSRGDLETDRMLALSIVKSIEIVGEAAAGVSAEFRKLYPDIPWQDIVAMRNRLVHVYFDIDLDRVWDTLLEDLPKLTADLERVIASSTE